jgi:Kae1-associated kinase Bud32
MKLLNKGSESKIFQISHEILKKIRVKKKYRIEIIDTKLRKLRNRSEFKILKKLEKNKINSPKVFELIEKKEFSFTLEKINGIELKNKLTKKNLFLTFENIIKIHKLDIIHNDLTTLNFLVENKTNKIFIIDFGLSFISKKIEDKASDLNLFFENINLEHRNFTKYKNELIEIYSKKIENSEKILNRLIEIEKRGRNKT